MPVGRATTEINGVVYVAPARAVYVVAGGDLLEIVENFMDCFVEESCGYCTPCRVGNVLLRETLQRVRSGGAEPQDLENLEILGDTVRKTSRCGLGQTSPNPILSSLKNFRHLYEDRVAEAPDGRRRSFDLDRAVQEATALAGLTAAGTQAPQDDRLTPAGWRDNDE